MAADEIIVETTSAEVIEVGVPGPQGPAGAAGAGLTTLTTAGDLLYRDNTEPNRLPIGSNGQVLKVSGGLPVWQNESGSVSSVAGRTGAITLNSTDIATDQALEISEAGNADCNGVFVYGGLFNGRPTYYSTKDTFVYWDNTNWAISHNGTDQYFGSSATRPWQSTWSLGAASNPVPVVEQITTHEFEKVVGQRTNPTALGNAAGKNVGTGVNDVAAGNHTHAAATTSVAGFLSAADKTKLNNAVETSRTISAGSGLTGGGDLTANRTLSVSFGSSAGTVAEGNDARLSDSRNPLAHKASHATGGADALAPSDIGAQSIFSVESLVITTTSQVTLTAARATIYDIVQYAGAAVDVKLPSTNAIQGDVVVLRWGTGSNSINVVQSNTPAVITTVSSGEQKRFIRGSTDSWSLVPVDTHTHAASAITSGTLDIARIPTGTSSTQVALGNHTHELTALAATGATNGHVLTANGSGGVTFAAASGGGISAVGASTADVLSVSGSDLVADDGGLIDSADPFIKWDDAAGKLVYANPLSRPSGAFYVGLAPTTTALGSGAVNIQPSRAQGSARLASALNAISIGESAQSSAEAAISIGFRPVASAFYAVAIGQTSTASGEDSVAIAINSSATANRAVAIGRAASSSLRAMFGTLPFNAVYWGGQTTNNTATVLNLDATATNRFTIAANTALAVDILLVARRSDTADKWLVARRFLGIRRDGSNNTSLIGAVQDYGVDQSAGSPTWTFSLTADDTNEALQLEVTGASGETVQWRATAFYRVV